MSERTWGFKSPLAHDVFGAKVLVSRAMVSAASDCIVDVTCQ